MDILETLLNWLGPLVFGSIFVELGISRWFSRKFCWRLCWAILLIAIGIKSIFCTKSDLNLMVGRRANVAKVYAVPS